ncbi:tRNA (adenosine(37)-N6)-threonylcarbamoyltransferase complex transferase subunit TsaD [Portibacter lacus]|uniref:tRNA N6-adenosine threonylcarbamoyltransferase n=1 Tax=Portibacter lacus TaxID=1099794 RepID=A0AA37SNE9_9BACT|nr:tRNA (adenosine(37)-N6)-threonylcarbamoyltransferase complex transferase subunit TsaD [Portibacter lacus]GLR16269.1 tRNA N6-adenosine threonylcarbamoyltransferase [Portibacter lacus]
MKSIYILAIESSCDDTAAAIIQDDKIIANGVSTQKIHQNYGGVVPEWASRKHQENIIPLLDHVMKLADIELSDLDAIAFTRGPGLLGSLIVGVSFAKSLALSLDIPIIEIHHMKAHVMAHFIEDPKPTFPFLCLTVSGGHTQIIKVKSHNDMKILGTTLDDAAGEAFDKAGKMMGLPYPAGPEIDRLAAKGNPVFDFPEPRIDGLDFSFSGLKTAFRYFLRDQTKLDPNFIENNKEDICASIQHKIVDILLNKVEKAVKQTGLKQVAIAGGVSANSGLRNALQERALTNHWTVFVPKFEYCTDNAAMIAISAYFKYLDNDFSDHSIGPEARLAW